MTGLSLAPPTRASGQIAATIGAQVDHQQEKKEKEKKGKKGGGGGEKKGGEKKTAIYRAIDGPLQSRVRFRNIALEEKKKGGKRPPTEKKRGKKRNRSAAKHPQFFLHPVVMLLNMPQNRSLNPAPKEKRGEGEGGGGREEKERKKKVRGKFPSSPLPHEPRHYRCAITAMGGERKKKKKERKEKGKRGDVMPTQWPTSAFGSGNGCAELRKRKGGKRKKKKKGFPPPSSVRKRKAPAE